MRPITLALFLVMGVICTPGIACPLHTQAEEPSRESVKK